MKLFGILLPHLRTRREAELDYLRGAASLYDLEMREREIERGKFARF